MYLSTHGTGFLPRTTYPAFLSPNKLACLCIEQRGIHPLAASHMCMRPCEPSKTCYTPCPQVEAALKLARRAVRAAPSLRPGWLILARCYARSGQLPLALLALNSVLSPALPLPEEVCKNMLDPCSFFWSLHHLGVRPTH